MHPLGAVATSLAAASTGHQMDPLEAAARRMNPASVAAAAAATGPAAASTGHQMDLLEAADRRMYPQPMAASATGLMDPAVVVGRQMYQVVPLSLHETLA